MRLIRVNLEVTGTDLRAARLVAKGNVRVSRGRISHKSGLAVDES